MNEEFAKEILQDLISSLEALETQTAAILQYLNDKEPADKEALASCLERAGQASSIRWRAARARIDRLLSSAMKSVEEEVGKEAPKPKASNQEEEADREKKTTQRPENAGQEESKTKEESKIKQADEQNGRENRTAVATQGGKTDAENNDVSVSGGEDNQRGRNDSSRNEGSEERKPNTEANEGGTQAKEKVA
jgi:hypothetical protein